MPQSRKPYIFMAPVLLGAVALLCVRFTNAGQPAVAPKIIAGTTFYPRALVDGSPSWEITYDPKTSGKWVFTRTQKMPDGTDSVKRYDAAQFKNYYPMDLGRAIRPSDLNHVVVDFAKPDKRIPLADLAILKITLGCQGSIAEIAKSRFTNEK